MWLQRLGIRAPPATYAEVVERSTHWVEGPGSIALCGFDSRPPHRYNRDMPQFKKNQLADGSVDGAKVENNSLTGDDIQDGTILSADLAGVDEAKITYASKTRNVSVPVGAFAPGPGNVVLTEWGSGVVGFSAWAFSNNVVETVDAPFVLPEDWKSGTDLTVVTYWAPGTSQDANIAVKLRYSHMEVGSVASAGTSTSTEALLMGTANTLRSQAFTIPADAGWAAGEIIYIRVYRVGNDGADTYSYDSYFVGMSVEYTSDKRGS